MKQQEGKSGRWFVRLMTSLLQFLYNRIYITGIQTLRIFARIRNRLIRFLRPLGGLFRRLYARFLRRRVRFLHFSGVRILRNLRWESGKIKRTHQTHGLRKAIVHVTRSTSHRAVLSAAVQVVLPLAAVGFLVLTIQFWNNQNYALFLDYGGEESIVIEDEGVFEEAAEMMNQRMVFDAATETELRVHGVYQLGIVSPGVCKSVDTVCDSLIQSSSDVISEAAGLYVNGELTGVVRSSTDLRYLLETMLSDEKAEQKADSAEYLESVELINGLFPTERIESADAVRKTMEDELHIMVSRKETYTESISYKTVTQKDSSQYTDYSRVTQQGKEGERTCVDTVYYVGDEEVRREEVSREVTREPVNKVVVVGTKKRPTGKIPGEASGTFTWPSPSVRYVTSTFGARWGTTHWGIDIAGSGAYGQTIVAADGGTVSYVKLHNYGYGYHLLIDHGNGYQTLYAHASKILVTSGQKVAKGQAIAQIGSTGDSTGPHLHFEIIKNGSKVDPLPYIQ